MRRETAAALVALLAIPAAALAADGANEPDRLVIGGSLRSPGAERLTVPHTSSWMLQLAWLIDEGATVEPGDAVARFDPAGAAEALAQQRDRLRDKRQERRLARADGRVGRLQLELELARARIAERKATLDAAVPEGVLSGKTWSERQREAAEATKKLRDAELALATHDVTQASRIVQLDIDVMNLETEIEEAEQDLASLTLRASRAGIVVHETNWNGEKVRPGEQLRATQAVASISDPATLEVEAWAAETDVGALRAGQPARLVLDAASGRTFRGRITEVARHGDTRRRWGRAGWFRVQITIDEHDTSLMRPGMSVRCEVESDAETAP